MVADIQENPDEVEHLPNIDFNIRQGNTLIGYKDLMETSGKNKKLDNWGKNNVKSKYKDVIKAIEKHKKAQKSSKATKWRNEAENKINEYKEDLNEKLLEEFHNTGIDDIDLKELEDYSPFHWVLEFAEVYSRGGFDVVIGNPPWIRIQELKKSQPTIIDYLKKSKRYKTPYYNYDIAIPFTERAKSLLHKDGRMAFITTNKWLQTRYGGKLRELLSEERSVKSLIDFTDQQVFEGISTYALILILSDSENEKIDYGKVNEVNGSLGSRLSEIQNNENNEYVETFDASYKTLGKNPWTFVPKKEAKILRKISKYEKLGNRTKRIFQGIITGKDKLFILDLETEKDNTYIGYSELMDKNIEVEKGIAKPILKGDEFSKWYKSDFQKIVLYPYRLYEKNGEPQADLYSKDEFRNKYPKAFNYLKKNKDLLESRERGKWEGVEEWYQFSRRQNIEQFEQKKIMTSVLNKQSKFALDDGNDLVFVGGGNAGGYGVTIPDGSFVSYEYLVAILNSRLLEWNLQKISSKFRGNYFSYGKKYIEKLPIIRSNYKEVFEKLTEFLMYLTKEFDRENVNELITDLENLIKKDDIESFRDNLINDEKFMREAERIHMNEDVKLVDKDKLRKDRFKGN